MKKSYSEPEMKKYNISAEEKIATVCYGGVDLKYEQSGWGCGDVPMVDVNTTSCIAGTWGDQTSGVS